MAQVMFELVWLKQFLSELGFKVLCTTKIIRANQAALLKASNLVFHERTKHMRLIVILHVTFK